VSCVQKTSGVLQGASEVLFLQGKIILKILLPNPSRLGILIPDSNNKPTTHTNMTKFSLYRTALNDAIEMLNNCPDLEPTSALKQAGSDNGIEYGFPMQSFVVWANGELFSRDQH